MPVSQRKSLTPQLSIAEKLAKIAPLEAWLNKNIVGQAHAMRAITQMATDHAMGLNYSGKPIGSGLLLGTTGVGKTESVKQLSNFLYGSDSGMAIFDMANYQNRESLPDLLGATGSNNSGALGKEIDRLNKLHSGGILLFDEIEKAHNDVVTIFLSILDDARIRFANGQVHKLDNFWIFMTTNVGADKMKARKLKQASINKMILEDASEKMRPELMERFEHQIVFRMLDTKTQFSIAKINIDAHVNHVEKKTGFRLRLDKEGVVRHTIKKGFTRELGARRVKKIAKREINDALTRLIQSREITEGAEIYIQADTDKLIAEYF